MHPNSYSETAPQTEHSPTQSGAGTDKVPDFDTIKVDCGPELAMPVPSRIGRYSVCEVLGRGGFGCVYRAYDPNLQRDVALKVPRYATAWTEESRETFLNEARRGVQLHHRHVVTIYDAARCDEHGVFIAMEYVHGESLAQRLQRGPLSVADAARILFQVAEAVHHAHKLGVVHRDLKPANILLDGEGNAKVCDFGLALEENAQRHGPRDISGTLGYMSPEQVRGETPYLDGRTDIWSLGVILYECLIGKRPFRGDGADEVRDEILYRDPKPLRQIDDALPKALDDLCRRCLAKNVADRTPTALDVCRCLEPWMRPSKRGGKGWTAPALAACSLVLAVLIAVGAFAASSRKSLGLPREPLDVPRRPLDGNLLTRAPRPLVFDQDNELEGADFNRESARFSVRSVGWSAFALGEAPSRPYTLNARCLLDEWKGRVGVMWGLHLDPQALSPDRYEMAAVFAEAVSLQELQVYVCLFTVQRHQFGNLYVSGDWQLDTVRIPYDRQQPLTFRVRVVEGAPQAIAIQEREVPLWRNFARAPWERYAGGEVGILACHGRIVVSHASLQTASLGDR